MPLPHSSNALPTLSLVLLGLPSIAACAATTPRPIGLSEFGPATVASTEQSQGSTQGATWDAGAATSLEAPAEPAWERSASVSLGGSYTITPGANGGPDSSSVAGNARLGYYLNPNLEIGLGYNGSATDPDGGGYSIGSSTTSVDSKYHFAPMQRTDPYLGVRAGFTAIYIPATGGYETNGSFGFVAGLNFNVNPSTAFYIEYAADSTAQESGTTTTGGIFVGLTYFF